MSSTQNIRVGIESIDYGGKLSGLDFAINDVIQMSYKLVEYDEIAVRWDRYISPFSYYDLAGNYIVLGRLFKIGEKVIITTKYSRCYSGSQECEVCEGTFVGDGFKVETIKRGYMSYFLNIKYNMKFYPDGDDLIKETLGEFTFSSIEDGWRRVRGWTSKYNDGESYMTLMDKLSDAWGRRFQDAGFSVEADLYMSIGTYL